jgi:hypothetical protein
MQSKVGHRVPLAFLLAMGAESLGGSFDTAAAARALNPGVLAPLAEQALAATEPSAPGRQQLAQFFPNFPNFPNFFNCFMGMFRRC